MLLNSLSGEFLYNSSCSGFHIDILLLLICISINLEFPLISWTWGNQSLNVKLCSSCVIHLHISLHSSLVTCRFLGAFFILFFVKLSTSCKNTALCLGFEPGGFFWRMLGCQRVTRKVTEKSLPSFCRLPAHLSSFLSSNKILPSLMKGPFHHFSSWEAHLQWTNYAFSEHKSWSS